MNFAFSLYRPWDQANLVLNSIEKVKPGSLLSLICIFPESDGTKFWSHSFHLQIFRHFTDQNGPKGGLHENEFWHFSNIKMNIHNSGRRHEIQTNDLIFFICFWSPNCLENSFFHLKIVKINLPILVSKIPEFCRWKLWD